MEWLLEHEGDPDIDVPLTEAQLQQLSQGGQGAQLGDAETMQRLTEMGFTEAEVATALQASGGSYETACAWLLGERDEDAGTEEAMHILQASLQDANVQAGLTNPRVIEALHAIVEDPTALQQYLSDPDVGPLLAALAGRTREQE
mmetsp:Transcript_44003/g.95426  ORF Transcript_44003/g.95426 Transcript_44003/m.95426 type:complete len:145 (+) Transcript_44003:613-1047(+)